MFAIVNAFTWWSVYSHHEKLKKSELNAFVDMERSIVQDAARAAETWIKHRSGKIDMDESVQEVLHYFIEPLKLLKSGDAWIFRNGYSIYDESSDFPEVNRGKTIKQIFDMQKRSGASHYDTLVKGVMQGNADTTWFIWLPEKGREYGAWTSIKIGKDILTIGISTPESEILAASGLEQELQRDIITGALQSALTLILLVLVFYAQYKSHQHIEALQHEIGDRFTVEKALRESEDRYRRLFSESKATQLIFDSASGQILDANEAAIRYYGYSLDELKEMSFTQINASSKTAVHDEVALAKEEERDYYLFRHRLATGEARNIEMYTTPLRINGNNVHYAIIHDITERKQMEEMIKRLGRYDVLTGLPNRAMLFDRINTAIESAKRHKEHLAILFLDLDGFKVVNDTYGHIAGDRLLREAAKRLKNCTRKSDTVARFGGDEFVVLLTDVKEDPAVLSVIEKIQASLRLPFNIEETTANIGSSVGVAFYPANGETADKLLHQADTAMYRVKQQGKNGYRFAESA
ncbi:sensor domain-containing diguanylate cyclase [Solemya velesiana gill symbiont]|uniref:Diguanylate cyclase n=1 Tax=Solemya velesiana gill symbiont TaxID=1918948 RepID=A0A1T2KUY0_9GAMM|nr:sensor domain-containing diguanylate cyclase [Solemya velesiana gill symbiont]OOZ36634.1 hypothetical protein BOW51_06240 [Solemya velesiana gill symbiont]